MKRNGMSLASTALLLPKSWQVITKALSKFTTAM